MDSNNDDVDVVDGIDRIDDSVFMIDEVLRQLSLLGPSSFTSVLLRTVFI